MHAVVREQPDRTTEELIGTPQNLLEINRALLAGTLQTPPNFLLDHMPKAYAIWSWNDYDAHG